MHVILKCLKRFIFHKDTVGGSLIMERQIWNPKSKETPAFAVPYVSQSCCGGSSALVRIRNFPGWLSECKWVRYSTKEGGVLLGCVTGWYLQWPSNTPWAVFFLRACEGQFQPRVAWGSVAKNQTITLFSACRPFQGNWGRQSLIIFSSHLECVLFLRISTALGHARTCRQSVIMFTDVM